MQAVIFYQDIIIYRSRISVLQGCHILEKSWVFLSPEKSLNFVYKSGKSLKISKKIPVLHRDRIVKLLSR